MLDSVSKLTYAAVYDSFWTLSPSLLDNSSARLVDSARSAKLRLYVNFGAQLDLFSLCS